MATRRNKRIKQTKSIKNGRKTRNIKRKGGSFSFNKLKNIIMGTPEKRLEHVEKERAKLINEIETLNIDALNTEYQSLNTQDKTKMKNTRNKILELGNKTKELKIRDDEINRLRDQIQNVSKIKDETSKIQQMDATDMLDMLVKED